MRRKSYFNIVTNYEFLTLSSVLKNTQSRLAVILNLGGPKYTQMNSILNFYALTNSTQNHITNCYLS